MIEDLLKKIDYDIKIDSSIYYFNDKLVPRVTDILSKTIHEDYLMKWANSLGFRRINYMEELNRAAVCGTKAHSAIEKFLKHKEDYDKDNIPFQSFLLWWEAINQSNQVNILGQEENFTQVPLIGTVTAGLPILAVEQIEGYIPYGGRVSRDKPLFALKVRGESMLWAGIHDGDIVVAEKTPYANNGDIVVAMLEDEATVKRFFKENGHFRLQPENDEFEPIITNEVAILGKVVSLIRYY